MKPENILLNKEGQVKIADFGVAKIVAGPGSDAVAGSAGAGIAALETQVGGVIGTPAYMAPEQIENPAEVDHRADIYALGVVLYQMLTGELPSKPVQAPSSKLRIDVRLNEVVLKALANNPEQRYQQANEMRTGVENILTKHGHASRPSRSSAPVGTYMILSTALIVAAVWGYFADLQNGQVGWFLWRLATTPLVALGLFRILESRSGVSRATAVVLAVLIGGLVLFIIFDASSPNHQIVVMGDEYDVNGFPIRANGVSSFQEIYPDPEFQIAKPETPQVHHLHDRASVPAFAWGITCVGFAVLGLLAARLRKRIQAISQGQKTEGAEGKSVRIDKSILWTTAAMLAVLVGGLVLFIIFETSSSAGQNVIMGEEHTVTEIPIRNDGVSTVKQVFDTDPDVQFTR